MPFESQERYRIFDGNQEQENHAAGHQSFALFPQLHEDLRLQAARMERIKVNRAEATKERVVMGGCGIKREDARCLGCLDARVSTCWEWQGHGHGGGADVVHLD